MIWVCQNHVRQGVEKLNVPHIRKVKYDGSCLFCQQKAAFEIYYFNVGDLTDQQLNQELTGSC